MSAFSTALLLSLPVFGLAFGLPPSSPEGTALRKHNGHSANVSDSLLTVHVLDSYTHDPIVDVAVSLMKNSELVAMAKTDNEGIATLSFLATHTEEEYLPHRLILGFNYPNPFVNETRLPLTVPGRETLSLEIYNLIGQRLMSEKVTLEGGNHTISLSLGQAASGVYFLRIIGSTSATRALTKIGGGPGPSQAFLTTEGGVTEQTLQVARGTSDDFNVTSNNYALILAKDRYESLEYILEPNYLSTLQIGLQRMNRVTLVVDDHDFIPLDVQLQLTGPHGVSYASAGRETTLGSGLYRIEGASDSNWVEGRVRVPSVDTTFVIRGRRTQPVTGGVMLDGDENASIGDATYDLLIPVSFTEDHISTVEIDGLLTDVLRTQVEIAFSPNATVGEVNDLLDRYQASIIGMDEGLGHVVIHFPDPGDGDGLNALIEKLSGEPRVEFVVPVDFPRVNEAFLAPQVLPPHLSYTESDTIAHHLAIRANAAWNFRHLLPEWHPPNVWNDKIPTIIIADMFGDGVPERGFTARFRPADFRSNMPNFHGYHVLGIVAGRFDPDSRFDDNKVDERGVNMVTGIYPQILDVRVLDVTGLTFWVVRKRLIGLIRDVVEEKGGRVIVNTSLSANSPWLHARLWTRQVRGKGNETVAWSGLESSFIHFTSAGNWSIRDGKRWDASLTSGWSYAGLKDNSILLGQTYPALRNIHVVENRRHVTEQVDGSFRYRPGCLDQSTISGGTISSIGTNVYSLGECLLYDYQLGKCVQHDTRIASRKSGTSMSSPQAAGLAAFIWGLNPTRDVKWVMETMQNHARFIDRTSGDTPFCLHEAGAPVVDAFDLALAADPIRTRRDLLDITRSGKFDHDDVAEFVSVFTKGMEPGYSRFDLNGDGKVGGDGTDRFDLDISGDYGVVTQRIDGELVEFDERSLTDLEMLCYYAYSDFYAGDTNKRQQLLRDICLKTPMWSTVGSLAVWGRQVFVHEEVRSGVAIAAGGHHSVVVRDDGHVITWGANDFNVAMIPTHAYDIRTVSTSGRHTLALRHDGTVIAWGESFWGQVRVPDNLPEVAAVAAGGRHSLLLLKDGSLRAFGQNSSGQATAPSGPSNFVAIAAGLDHNLALRENGVIVAWGASGDSRTIVPGGLSDAVAIAAGAAHSLALRSDATVVGWGRNTNGQTTIPADLSNVVAIAAGANHSLALRADGTVVAWGRNNYGQASVPSDLSDVVAITAGAVHSLALRGDGTLVAWGADYYGQAIAPGSLKNVVAVDTGGDYHIALRSDSTVFMWGWSGISGGPVVPEEVSGVIAVAAGNGHALAIRENGTVIGWGSNLCGQATAPAGLSDAIAVAAGLSHSLVLRSNGTVVGWGCFGAARIPAGLDDVVAIDASSSYSVALRRDGTVVAWGDFPAWTPPGLSEVTAISASAFQILALRRDGSMIAWGHSPTSPPSVPDVVAIAAGPGHGLALDVNGSVTAWGLNNTYGESTVPATISRGLDIRAASSLSVAIVANQPPEDLMAGFE